MASDLDKRIQQRAYEIWENEGRPEGRQHEHWQQARAEFSEAKSEAGAVKGGWRKASSSGDGAGRSGAKGKSGTGGTEPKAGSKTGAAAAKPKAGAKAGAAGAKAAKGSRTGQI